MKTTLKYLTIVALAIATLTWFSSKVTSTEGEGAGEDVPAREAYRRMQLQDENGQIPPNALIDAYKQKEGMQFLPAAWGEFMQGSGTGVVQGSKPGLLKNNQPGVLQSSEMDEEIPSIPNPWVPIGPGNIGGRIRSIIIHPTANPRTIWVGAVSGGVWKSTDDGTSWSTKTDFLANLGVHCMAIDPGNSNILYAGTGEAFRGNGIFKTTNGGDTWTRLNSTANNPDFYFVNRLAVSPRNSQLLLAATATSYPYEHGGSGKIFRSTDGGESWSATLALPDNQMADVRFRPINAAVPDDPAAASNCIASSYQGGVYFSFDDGAHWTPSGGLPPLFRVELAYSPSNPSIVYASADEHLYRSYNGGLRFDSTGSPPPLPGTNPYANALWIDPTAQANSNTVIAGGIYLSRSTDGGGSWGGAVNSGIHLDHHVIVEDPGYNGTTNQSVYGGNDGGIYKTNNVLASPVIWTPLNSNLPITQFYGAAGHVASGRIIGGTQDNGSLLSPVSGSQAWTTIFGPDIGGDGGFCAVDQTGNPFFYGEFVNLQIWRSKDGAQTKWYIFNGPNGIPADCPNGYGNAPCANFIAPFVLDPNNENRILAGGRSLWRSNDARNEVSLPSWAEIKSPIVDESGNFVNINAIAVAQDYPDFIWVGYNNGSIYYTTTGTRPGPSPSPTPTWTRVDPNHMLPQGRVCTRITIGQAPEAADPQIAVARTVYATFGGFPSGQSGNVWKTQDSGGTWTNISGPLPRAPVYSLVISPSHPNVLYVGTEVGVFASSDGGATWSPSNGGPANVPVFELFWMGPKLVAATHGRGIFTLGPTDH